MLRTVGNYAPRLIFTEPSVHIAASMMSVGISLRVRLLPMPARAHPAQWNPLRPLLPPRGFVPVLS